MFTLAVTSAQHEAPDALAASPGAQSAPLLTCPDFSGDGTVDLFNDIFGVAFKFGSVPGDGTYHPLYDFGGADGVIDLFNDIFAVAFRFGDTCPLVDVQVAQATQWGIANIPVNESEAALEAMGYYRASSDAPGQGVHYVKLTAWDGVFDPEEPEGLVYNDGKIVAQLYVVTGQAIGWGSYEIPSSYTPPLPTRPSDIDLEVSADGPQCDPACSWDGSYDGWHLHYWICTVHIGTGSAVAVPNLSPGACDALKGGEPACTIPITAQPCYQHVANTGWMGHLWNHQLNPNKIADLGGDNGRFADCSPDVEGWKAFDCPG
jgi:hypothetical protein